MKWIILLAIRFYWLLVPPGRRRNCLFKESCSTHIYKIIRHNGFFPGLKAFLTRFRQCRLGFQLCNDDAGAGFQLILADGSKIGQDDISQNLIRPYIKAAAGLEALILESHQKR